MAICYDRLFHMMIDRKISHVQLKNMACVSANIMTRLRRNEYILILSILVYTFFSRMFDLMLPPVAKHSIVVA